jgi:hypothetical protein
MVVLRKPGSTDGASIRLESPRDERKVVVQTVFSDDDAFGICIIDIG